MRVCRRRNICSKCKRRHPTAFHDIVEEIQRQRQEREDDGSEQSKPEEHAVSNRIKVNRTFIGDTHSMIVPVWLYQSNNSRNKVLVYALLDDQSDACFIKESTLNTIKGT